MRTPESRKRRSRAFTLIELLVVIAIIAILASIAFPVYVTVLDRARGVEAKDTMHEVRVALANYWGDYTEWPPAFLAGVAPSDDARIDAEKAMTSPNPGKWSVVYNTLIPRGDDGFLSVNNKRRLHYMPFPPKHPNNKDANFATTFLDPWGHEYNIAIDSNGDGKIEGLPNPATGKMDLTVNADMVLWSYGRDPSKIRQYIVSW